jgi:hypothetical protein
MFENLYIGKWKVIAFNYGRDHLTMSYFDHLDNRSLNKYEKNLKIERYIILLID